jgi:hypothetical protein
VGDPGGSRGWANRMKKLFTAGLHEPALASRCCPQHRYH